jgi:hypothetical protein
MKPVGAYDPSCCYDTTRYAEALERHRARKAAEKAKSSAAKIAEALLALLKPTTK